MTYVVTWNVIGDSATMRAELFDSLHDADAFYGLLCADGTVSNVKLIKGEII